MGQKDSKPKEYALSKGEIDQVARDTNARPDDVKNILRAFAKISNAEGKVSRTDFKRTIEEHYGGGDSTITRMIMLNFDKDGNNEIDFREFVMALQYMSTSSSLLDAIDTAFASFDLNGDGGISREELRAVYRSQRRMKKYVGVFKREKPLGEVNLDPKETMACHDDADRAFEKISKANSNLISKEEFKLAVEADEALRQEFQKLLLGASEGKEIFSPTSKK